MTEEPKLKLEIVWKDDEMLELQIFATNGRYSGTTEVYTTDKELLDLANKAEGFPKQITDSIEYVAGQKDSYAFLSLRFYCIDGLGHTAVEISLEEKVPTRYRPEEKHKVKMEIKYEPNAIDRFKTELLQMVRSREGCARLY